MSVASLELRRRIDQAVGRALFDQLYEQQLLADPARALGLGGAAPPQLATIHAVDLEQFAQQAHLHWWPQPEGGQACDRPRW